MSVSGKTSDFEIPYLEGSDIPDMGAGDQAIAERVDAILDGIDGDATLGTDLELTIADSAVTTDKLHDGAVTSPKIAAGAIETGKIEDGAVSSRKLAPTIGVKAMEGSSLVLTTSYADITLAGGNLTITPAVASLLKVTAVFDLTVYSESGDMAAIGTINLDGADQVQQAVVDSAFSSGMRATATQVYLLSLSAEKHTIKMRAKKGATGTGSASCGTVHTRMLYELVAA